MFEMRLTALGWQVTVATEKRRKETVMPKIERVRDRHPLALILPLRVTRRKRRQTSERSSTGPSIRVKCGCCSEAFVIAYDATPTKDPHFDTLEINGVMGTIDQWRQVLAPLLHL